MPSASSRPGRASRRRRAVGRARSRRRANAGRRRTRPGLRRSAPPRPRPRSTAPASGAGASPSRANPTGTGLPSPAAPAVPPRWAARRRFRYLRTTRRRRASPPRPWRVVSGIFFAFCSSTSIAPLKRGGGSVAAGGCAPMTRRRRGGAGSVRLHRARLACVFGVRGSSTAGSRRLRRSSVDHVRAPIPGRPGAAFVPARMSPPGVPGTPSLRFGRGDSRGSSGPRR